MTKKVLELAQDLNVSSTVLLERARALGLKAKTNLSLLSDADVKALTDAVKQSSAKKGVRRGAAVGVPVGRPVVDENFLANKRKAPAGKPIVNEELLSKREETEKAEKAEKAETKAPKAAPAPAPKEETKTAAAAKKEAAPAEKAALKTFSAPAAADSKKDQAPAKAEKAEKAETKAPKAAPAPAEEAKAAAEPKAETKAAAAAKAAKPAEKAEKAEKKEEQKASAPKSDSVSAGKKADAPKEAKKEEKKEPKIHLAASEHIATPKIKIIKRAEPKKPGEKASGSGRNSRRSGQNGQNSGRPSGNRRNAGSSAGGRTQGRGGAGAGAGAVGGEHKRPQRVTSQGGLSQERGGRGRKKGRHEDSHSKFDKFEQKSLEKRERKKYTKAKQEVVQEVEEEVLPEGTFKLDVPITIAGFCEQTEMSTSQVIMALMKMGVMANINQTIDEETVMVLADELGINVVVGQVEEEVQEEGIEDFEDKEKDLKPRPPIVTVMGHVDHGKTSLLDAIRSTNVTATESGGITQHIGASEVEINGRKIVFLDTPGHEAFTAMRARGAHVTDIAVLVVAADDGVMPQTVESISHAKAAGVPIIVAINKMDKPGANPDRVKKELADHDVLVEDWGGSVISVEVSAKKRIGIEDLLEMILLQADMLELKANPNRLAMGSVIEAKLDKARGPVATLLVTNGTLRAGQSLVAGTCSGRIRLMTDYKGRKIHKAGPATAVEILGLTDVPQAGDNFNVVRDDKTAREIAARRQEKLREETMAKNSSMSLEKLFTQIQQGEVKELNLIIKADVQGSVGALITSLEKLNTDEVKVNIIHSGVGTVNESDVMLAETSNAVILGFNVRPSSAVTSQADQAGVEIRLYRVIYDALNDVEAAMKGMLEPEFKEEVLGKAVIRDTFKVPGVGIVGGAYITEGKVLRNAEIRLVRDGIVIHEGKISSLKRFKDDAKEVAQGYECGIGIEDYNDIKMDDVLECFHMVEVKAE